MQPYMLSKKGLAVKKVKRSIVNSHTAADVYKISYKVNKMPKIKLVYILLCVFLTNDVLGK